VNFVQAVQSVPIVQAVRMKKIRSWNIPERFELVEPLERFEQIA
jgi:hypothetical protein